MTWLVYFRTRNRVRRRVRLKPDSTYDEATFVVSGFSRTNERI